MSNFDVAYLGALLMAYIPQEYRCAYCKGTKVIHYPTNHKVKNLSPSVIADCSACSSTGLGPIPLPEFSFDGKTYDVEE